MLKKEEASGVAPGSLEGARSATGGEPGAAAEVRRWSAGRKKEVMPFHRAIRKQNEATPPGEAVTRRRNRTEFGHAHHLAVGLTENLALFEMRAAIAPAAALADLAAKQVDDACFTGHALSAAERAEAAVTVAEAKIAAHRAASFVTQEMLEATGASGTRHKLGFDRFWRNARTHTLHDPLDYKLNAGPLDAQGRSAGPPA